jgi:hypothetical protein
MSQMSPEFLRAEQAWLTPPDDEVGEDENVCSCGETYDVDAIPKEFREIWESEDCPCPECLDQILCDNYAECILCKKPFIVADGEDPGGMLCDDCYWDMATMEEQYPDYEEDEEEMLDTVMVD